jgi:hypothetical protein
MNMVFHPIYPIQNTFSFCDYPPDVLGVIYGKLLRSKSYGKPIFFLNYIRLLIFNFFLFSPFLGSILLKNDYIITRIMIKY